MKPANASFMRRAAACVALATFALATPTAATADTTSFDVAGACVTEGAIELVVASDDVRPYIPPPFDLPPGQTQMEVYGERCVNAVDGHAGQEEINGGVIVAVLLPDCLGGGLGFYELWTTTTQGEMHGRVTDLGWLDGLVERSTHVLTTNGLQASVDWSIPFQYSPHSLSAEGSAPTTPLPDFPLDFWQLGGHGFIHQVYEITDFVGGGAEATLHAEPDSPLFHVLGDQQDVTGAAHIDRFTYTGTIGLSTVDPATCT